MSIRASLSTWRVPALVLAGAVAAGACSGDGLTPPLRPDPGALYWTLDLDHHAVTLAMDPRYDTLTLSATPRNYLGEPIAGLPAPTFSSQNADVVIVTPDGHMRAVAPLAPGSVVMVYAKLNSGDLEFTDSAMVYVAPDAAAPRLATFSARPLPPDSAKIGASIAGIGLPMTDTLLVRATDSAGQPVDGLLVSFRSSDTTIAKIDPRTGELFGTRPGDVAIYAGTTMFGVSKADTVPYRIGWPVNHIITLEKDPADMLGKFLFGHDRVTIGVGGMVVWNAATLSGWTQNSDIMFVDPTNVAAVNTSPSGVGNLSLVASFTACIIGNCDAAGNITLVPTNYPPEFGGAPAALGGAGRVFPVAGTYEYYSSASRTRGVVVVVQE